MTARRQKLYADATAAGYTVEQRGTETVVYRRDRWGREQGITIFENGTAVLLDTRLDVCKGMRSYADWRSVLGLGPEKSS